MYGKALKEVNEVLENMDEIYTRKISSKFMNMMLENIDWSYEFKYDLNKKIEEQNLSEDAKAILSILYLRYFADEDEKLELISQMRQNDIESEKIKSEKYNLNRIFQAVNEENLNLENTFDKQDINTKDGKNSNKDNFENLNLVKQPEVWYKKILIKLKRFLKNI